MKRFSESRDHEFEIGGQVFKWQHPYWEEITAIFDQDRVAIDDGTSATMTAAQSMQQFIDRVKLFLPTEDHERWQQVATRKDEPVAYYQIRDVYSWLIEVATSRPTEQPSSSDDGPTNSEPGSPDA